MPELEDLVTAMERAFEELLGRKIPSEARTQIQRRIAQEFGGERIYVPKNLARPGFVLGDAPLDLSGSLSDVMRRYRVSRATVVRLRRKRK